MYTIINRECRHHRECATYCVLTSLLWDTNEVKAIVVKIIEGEEGDQSELM